jgi:hypothetical protein
VLKGNYCLHPQSRFVTEEIMFDITKFNRSLLQNPGDEITMKITKTGRKVIKYENKVQHLKRSAVKYQNGRIVETISYQS